MLCPYPVVGLRPTPRPIDTVGPVAAVPPESARDLEHAQTGAI